LIRLACIFLAGAALASAGWVESVEFPWATFPRSLWERELVWLKNIGIRHVSLPQAPTGFRNADEQRNDLIRILRRLEMEADLESPVPESLRPQTTAHGGPLTEPLAQTAVRMSASAPDALLKSRKALTSGNPAVVWTDVEDTLGPNGYHAGAVDFSGRETPATMPLRRSAQLSRYWAHALATLHALPGAGTRLPAQDIAVEQFVAESGASFVSVVNNGAQAWTGDVKAFYPPAKKLLVLPNVTVRPHDSVWLPVGVPLMAGPLCHDCSAFATTDHLIYATAELTAMEYENGILALEFAAPVAGEVVLQVSQQPTGPLMAGGAPAGFDWDDTDKRVRLPVPAGSGAAAYVRIGLAIEPPDETAFFDAARVLLIGEANPLVAQFSSAEIAKRSRLVTVPELASTQSPGKEPLRMTYAIKVPETSVHGDHAELSIEADGVRLSHARPQLLRPVTARFTEAIGVRVGPNSVMALSPAVVPVNQRSGRDITISIRNNAPEIRSFAIEMTADGLDFSPPKVNVSVGAGAARDVSFRVFASSASPGIHAGKVTITGAGQGSESVRFAVIPPNGAVAFESEGVFLLESASRRAAFLPGRWLEYVNKENSQNPIPAGGISFDAGPVEASGDALTFGGTKTLHVADLEALAPKPKR
jgi:hypothetical protein